MNLNNLTAEEKKIFADGQLHAYCNDEIILEPPSHAECIFELFDSFKHTGNSRSGETPLEKLHNDFLDIDENELVDLIAYFKQVDYYCSLVCCAYAMKYPYPLHVGNESTEEREDIDRVISACRQRYPWLTQEYIEMYLVGAVYMCIR